MSFETIILTREEGIATVTLNRPEAVNTINLQMCDELTQVITEASQDDGIRVLVIKATGRVFCAGGDFRPAKVRAKEVTVEAAEDMAPAYVATRKGKLLPDPIQLQLLLQRLDKPTIAVVQGPAIGHGLDLALACDIRIGSPKARFVVGFTNMGLPPPTGGAWLMPRIVGLGIALQWIFTGEPCEAEEAYRIGLLNKLVPAEQLDDETLKLARRLAAGSPIAHRLAKLLVYKGLEMDFENALIFGNSCGFIAGASEDFKEGIKALAEKRTPLFEDR